MVNKYGKTDFYEYFTSLLLFVKTRVTVEWRVYCEQHHFKEFFLIFYILSFSIRFRVFTDSRLLGQIGKVA
jgi:hypothetical protein